MSRRRCGCGPTTRRRWRPGGARTSALTPARLAGRWEAEADQVDLATGADLEAKVCWRESPLAAPTWEELAAALVDPETGLCARSARFTHADVVEQLCAMSGGRLSSRGDRRPGRAVLGLGAGGAADPGPEAGGRRRRLSGPPPPSGDGGPHRGSRRGAGRAVGPGCRPGGGGGDFGGSGRTG